MKKEFTAGNGTQGMIIDCGHYDVKIFKHNPSDAFVSPIEYIDKITQTVKFIPSVFKINWDEEKDGGKLELKYRDSWGSEMVFIHYAPSDVKGMFDFIGKGYNIFSDGFGSKIDS